MKDNTNIVLNTIGSDPEFFIRDKKSKRFIPSSFITNGTKNMPESINKGFFIHKDNLTVEGNIPPAKTREEFIANMKFIKSYINTLAEVKNLELVSSTSAKFQNRYIGSNDGQEFGCNNFYSCWDRSSKRIKYMNTNLRFSGFHIHYGYKNIGYSRLGLNKCISIAFDIFLTYPSVLINECIERDEYYNNFGAYRPTNYGIECRSLGGYFTRNEYLGWIWDQSIKMFNWLNDKKNVDLIRNIYFVRRDEVKNHIKSFIEKNNLENLIFKKEENLINV